jgi:hypothetical protein
MNTAAHRNLKEIERLQRAEATLAADLARQTPGGFLHRKITQDLESAKKQLAARMARMTAAL